MKRSSLVNSLILIWALLVLGAFTPGVCLAQQPITSDTFAELAQKTGGAVVNISTEKVVKNKAREFLGQMPGQGPGQGPGPRSGHALPLRTGGPLPGVL